MLKNNALKIFPSGIENAHKMMISETIGNYSGLSLFVIWVAIGFSLRVVMMWCDLGSAFLKRISVKKCDNAVDIECIQNDASKFFTVNLTLCDEDGQRLCLLITHEMNWQAREYINWYKNQREIRHKVDDISRNI